MTVLRTVHSGGTVITAGVNKGPRSLHSRLSTLLIPSVSSITLTGTLRHLLASSRLHGRLTGSTCRQFIGEFAVSIVGGGLMQRVLSTG